MLFFITINLLSKLQIVITISSPRGQILIGFLFFHLSLSQNAGSFTQIPHEYFLTAQHSIFLRMAGKISSENRRKSSAKSNNGINEMITFCSFD